MSSKKPVFDTQMSTYLQKIISRCDLYPHVVQGSGKTLRLSNIMFYLSFFSIFLTPGQAKAEIEDPLMRGLVVGGVSGASAVGGSLIGIVSGFTLGDLLPGDFAPVGLAFIGGVVGGAIGAPIGAYTISEYAGADKMMVTRNTAIVSSIGALCSLVGSLGLNDTLIFTGAGTLLASPLAAGITATYSPSDNSIIQSTTVTPLSFTPVVTADYTGFVFGAQF